MTEGEKRCGLSSFLPMSCRGRAEAFARRLHNRLQSLGSHEGNVNSENGWLTNNEAPNLVTSLQPRHSTSENDIFMDFGLFDTPGSPDEEVVSTEITKFITYPKDDLHHANLDECGCISGSTSCHSVKRNSLDSNSSDGHYYDPENIEIESNCVANHVNGISNSESREDIVEFLPSCRPTTQSSDKNEYLEEESLKTSGWCVTYESENSISNNNIYSAINIESLKQNSSLKSSQEEISTDEDSSNDTNSEFYCSHLNIQQNLMIECPTENCIKPEVEVSTLEIHDIDEKEESILSSTEINDTNHLQVKPIENTEDYEIEERIPRVRRCSSLKTGKTPPGTPGRKKIVRFADVLGLDLADVRTFMDEIPKIPISAYDDLSGAELNLSLSDISLSSTSSGLESLRTATKTVVPLFQQPGGEANFMEKIRNNQVCLENAVLNDAITFCISGTVRVRNLDFNKSVHIRYTLDSWKSFSDLQTTYVEGSCDGFSDKFSFTLYVHTLAIGQRLEFAVRFQCKGCQYWDNNDGQNYCFQCLPASTSNSYTTLTSSDDITWAGAAFY